MCMKKNYNSRSDLISKHCYDMVQITKKCILHDVTFKIPNISANLLRDCKKKRLPEQAPVGPTKSGDVSHSQNWNLTLFKSPKL